MPTTSQPAGMMLFSACSFSVASNNHYKFTGKERDTESGLDYFGARHYTSSLSRFMTPDDGSDQSPSDPESWNLYSYVRNHPTDWIDPTGRCSYSGGKWVPDSVSDCSEVDPTATTPSTTITATMLPLLTNKQIHQLSDEVTGAGKFPWKDILLVIGIGKIASSVEELKGIQITGLNVAAADQAAEKIAYGHAFGKHAAELGAASKSELKDIVTDIVARANATNDVRQLNGGRIAYWDDSRKAVVIFDPNSVDKGTVFVPKQGRYYFDVVLK